MNSLDLFKMAIGNLWRRKTRTILTVLGVIIGTASIVVMISLGIAMDQSFKDQMDSMGDLNIIEVESAGYYGEESDDRDKKDVKLDDSAVARFNKIEGVQAVMPIKTSYMRVVAGKYVNDVQVTGIDPTVMEAFDFKIEEGRLLSSTDKNTIVFGKRTVEDFRDPRKRNRDDGEPPKVNLINNKLILTGDRQYGEKRSNRDSDYKPPKPHNIKGVGLLAESNGRNDYSVYMDIDSLQKIIKEDEKTTRDSNNRRSRNRDENKYENIKVKVKDINELQGIQEQIKAMGFQTYSLTDMLKSMKETSKKIGLILGGIGGVSLFVAAIGITNTMIMSIYERTREIGVMKVLGANLSDIKKLFLLEAGMIGLLGGLLGLIFSYAASYGLNMIGGNMMGGPDSKISMISIELALGALAFSTIIGVVSGYSPARRAMKLSALQAIKTE
ncbi:ABC transporter permease [Lutibacter sp. B2]|nr:ABC transporter permease [Lutibacter sp. B2]